ncbi:hypothetical protein KKP3000_003285 [Alicyclobacillus fastidiosus]|uniref:Uncharacterized protein n=1 Tax=Alicyclobacillus fastidiosus TaxID=392011 RepID=A0ABV5ACA1_9BACL
MKKSYHCCATCQHFRIGREAERVYIRCERLGYATQSHFQFSCWNPRVDIVEKMRRQSQDATVTSTGRDDQC